VPEERSLARTRARARISMIRRFPLGISKTDLRRRVLTRREKEGGREKGEEKSTRHPYVRRSRAAPCTLTVAANLEETGWSSHRDIPHAHVSFSGLSLLLFCSSGGAIYPALGKTRSEIDGNPERRWRRYCLMMTFKCGAASFDCSHGAAGRDVFLRFSFSCFSLYRFFIFSRVLSLSLSLLLYSFRISTEQL